mgnify:CR=1 FL=1
MNCRQGEKLLMRALDGELPAEERNALEAHLQTCAACRATEQTWREAGRRLRSESVPTPPAEVMWADVRRAIHQQAPVAGPAPSLLGWRLGWATAIVGALFVGVLGLGTWRLNRPEAPEALALSPPQVEWAEGELPGSSTMVYEDEESGVAVIWLLTAENDMETPKGS